MPHFALGLVTVARAGHDSWDLSDDHGLDYVKVITPHSTTKHPIYLSHHP
jgi:hypothetical protein